jgi:hypothetical protein
MQDKCEICRKSKEICLAYLGRNLCEDCWNKYSKMETSALREKIGLKTQPATLLSTSTQD